MIKWCQSVSTVWLFILGIANFANTKSMGKVNLRPCITHDWNPLKVLNFDNTIIGRQGENCYDINIESQTLFQYEKCQYCPKVIFKK